MGDSLKQREPVYMRPWQFPVCQSWRIEGPLDLKSGCIAETNPFELTGILRSPRTPLELRLMNDPNLRRDINQVMELMHKQEFGKVAIYYPEKFGARQWDLLWSPVEHRINDFLKERSLAAIESGLRIFRPNNKKEAEQFNDIVGAVRPQEEMFLAVNPQDRLRRILGANHFAFTVTPRVKTQAGANPSIVLDPGTTAVISQDFFRSSVKLAFQLDFGGRTVFTAGGIEQAKRLFPATYAYITAPKLSSTQLGAELGEKSGAYLKTKVGALDAKLSAAIKRLADEPDFSLTFTYALGPKPKR